MADKKRKRSGAGRRTEQGFTLMEMLIVMAVFSLLLIPLFSLVQRSHRNVLLDRAAKQIVAAMGTARSYSMAERKEFTVVFTTVSYSLFREGTGRIGKESPLPDFVVITEKTEAFAPVVFLPDGTSQQAGHLLLEEIHTKQRKKIILYNLTGTCKIEEMEP